MKNVRKSLLISSMLAALAVVSLPAVASAQTYGGQTCYGYNCPQPRPQRAPTVEVLVQEWRQVSVEVADFEWRWQWKYDSYSGWAMGWEYVKVGCHTEYQWRQVDTWVTATWDYRCQKYVYWYSGSRREVTSWDTTRQSSYRRW